MEKADWIGAQACAVTGKVPLWCFGCILIFADSIPYIQGYTFCTWGGIFGARCVWYLTALHFKCT